MGREKRSDASMATWESSWGGLRGAAAEAEGTEAATTVSTMVFHSWQLGQRPSHFRLSLPHCWQTYTVRLCDLSDLDTG